MRRFILAAAIITISMPRAAAGSLENPEGFNTDFLCEAAAIIVTPPIMRPAEYRERACLGNEAVSRQEWVRWIASAPPKDIDICREVAKSVGGSYTIGMVCAGMVAQKRAEMAAKP